MLGSAAFARAASYTARPAVEVEQTYDDNVLSDERDFDSWGTRIAPSLRLNRKTDLSELGLEFGLTRHEVYSRSELDGTDESISGTATRVLTPRLSVGLSGNYSFYSSYDAILQAQPIGLPQTLYSERPELTWGQASANFRYILNDLTELGGELEWNDYTYDESTRTDLFDDDERKATLTLTRTLTDRDKVGASVSYGLSEEDPSDTPFFINTELHTHNELGTGVAFWQRVWSPRWSTSFQAGTRILDSELKTEGVVLCDFIPPSTPVFCTVKRRISNSGTGFVGGATINHEYSDRGQISLSYVRDTQTGSTTSTGASAIDTDRFSVSLGHRLTSRLSLSLSGYYLAYQSTDEAIELNNEARTRLHGATARLDWQMRRNLVAYARFDYADADQFRPLNILDPRRQYDRRIYGVGFRYFFDLPDREP